MRGPFENWVLSGILDPNREEVTESWIKLHNKELHDLYSSQNTIGMIRSMRMIKAGHVLFMRKIINAWFWLENLKERDCLEDLA
jgi:hypothetical protein